MPEPWPTILTLIYVWASVLLFWRQPWLLFGLLAVGTAVLLRIRPTRRDLTVWVIATAVGLLGEYLLSSRSRYWVYAMPTWGGLPAWLFWVYGLSLLIGLRLAEWMHAGFTAALSARPAVYRSLIGVGVVLALWYGVVVYQTVARVFGLSYLILGLITVAFRLRARDVVLFWLAMVLGLVGEASCIAAGIFAYSFPYFPRWGIPISLPLAWGLLAVFVCRVGEVIAGSRPSR